MNDTLEWICRHTGAASVERGERIQSLWSGYGEIRRFKLKGGGQESVVVKSVSPPSHTNHPRGWNTTRSHSRKLQSYAVEHAFYERFAAACGTRARVPHCFATQFEAGRWLFLLEDLDNAGLSGRRMTITAAEIVACLDWLAAFHATFLGVEPHDLWTVGTYWHLATRPDELQATKDARLRAAAPVLDSKLNECRFQTFVHGDAKVANFCFPDRDGDRVAAVDFQYVGGGCGIKDVAYFLSSCMTDAECEGEAPHYLKIYFERLQDALQKRGADIDFAELETEWRALYPIAWADFYRFLAGWSPDHWKIHGYSDRLTREVLDALA